MAKFSKTIYIPHGSDETISNSISSKASFSFISHMVQMKQLKREWKLE
ncbi:hypothetical protein THER_1270 [Thermodesulfovibrio sp. N1]|nr:hypothetical protein THER_1270 [Thermodesulfovibrio sp. N1]